MAATKAPGRNIKNDERNTKMLLIRAPDEIYERFRALHAAWKTRDPKCTQADVLEAALDALDARGT